MRAKLIIPGAEDEEHIFLWSGIIGIVARKSELALDSVVLPSKLAVLLNGSEMKSRCSMPPLKEDIVGFVRNGSTLCVGSFFTSRPISDSISKDCIRTHKISTMIRECNSLQLISDGAILRYRLVYDTDQSALTPPLNVRIVQSDATNSIDRRPTQRANSQRTKLTAAAWKLIDRLSSNYVESIASLLAFVQPIRLIIRQFATPSQART